MRFLLRPSADQEPVFIATIKDYKGIHPDELSWERVSQNLGVPHPRLENYCQDKGKAKLKAHETDLILTRLGLQENFARLRAEKSIAFVNDALRAKAPFFIPNELGIKPEEQQALFERKETHKLFLTFRPAGQGKWAVGFMRFYRPALDEQAMPRFLSWRPIPHDLKPRFFKLKGYIIKSGLTLSLMGHVFNSPQMWSGIFHCEGDDLVGLHLSADGPTNVIRAVRAYGVGIDRAKWRSLRTMTGIIPDIEELGTVLSKRKLHKIKDYLLEAPPALEKRAISDDF